MWRRTSLNQLQNFDTLSLCPFRQQINIFTPIEEEAATPRTENVQSQALVPVESRSSRGKTAGSEREEMLAIELMPQVKPDALDIDSVEKEVKLMVNKHFNSFKKD